MSGNKLVFGLLVLLVVVGATIAASTNFQPLRLDTVDAADIVTLLTAAIFVALVIERAVEVFANNRYNPDRDEIMRHRTVLAQHIAVKRIALDEEERRREVNAASVDALRKTLDSLRERYNAETERIGPDLLALRRKKAQFAGGLATVLGLAVAAVAFRVLGSLVPDDVTLSTAQQRAFVGVDVVLTSALLAGGADGIHQIIGQFTAHRSKI